MYPKYENGHLPFTISCETVTRDLFRIKYYVFVSKISIDLAPSQSEHICELY